MIDGSGVLLVSSIGGYWVLERAATHKGALRRVGQWLGAIIIVTSLVGVACKVWRASTMCPFGARKRSMCPYPQAATPKTPSLAPSTTFEGESEQP